MPRLSNHAAHEEWFALVKIHRQDKAIGRPDPGPPVCFIVCLGAYFPCHEHLWWQVIGNALRENVFVEAFPGVQTAECPQVAEVKSGETTSVAKFAVCQNLREEPVN
jgi:hypothetical protein